MNAFGHVGLWHRAEDFRSCNKRDSFEGYKRRGQSVGIMPAHDPFRSIPGQRDAVDLAVQRGARQVLCRAWLGPRRRVRLEGLAAGLNAVRISCQSLGGYPGSCCSATKRPRSSATRRQVVRQSALVICVVRSQSAKHVVEPLCNARFESSGQVAAAAAMAVSRVWVLATGQVRSRPRCLWGAALW